MTFLQQIANNEAVLVVAGMSKLPYLWEISTFLFLAQVFDDVTAGTRVSEALRIGVRAFGGVHLVLPLVLGTLPSTLLRDMDRYLAVYVAVLFVFSFLVDYLPRKVLRMLVLPKKIAYCMFFANACCSGVLQGAAAFPHSFFTRIFVGFLAVMGGHLLEQGATTKLFKRDYSEDQLLALFGPVLFLFFMGSFVREVAMPESVARTLIVLFRVSCDYVDYNEMLAYANNLRMRSLRKVASFAKSR